MTLTSAQSVMVCFLISKNLLEKTPLCTRKVYQGGIKSRKITEIKEIQEIRKSTTT